MKTRQSRSWRGALVGMCGLWIAAMVLTQTVAAQQTPVVAEPPPIVPSSLLGLWLPDPTGIENVVVDRAAAVALGKALFWDTQVGSDGVTACATCHFHAGADARVTNQINPNQTSTIAGKLDVFDWLFTGALGANTALTDDDFPTRRLWDESDRNSAVLFDTDDVVGSAGVFEAQLEGRWDGRFRRKSSEPCSSIPDPVFHALGENGAYVNTRRVTPRHAPSVINAAYNVRQFWDGRAQDVFNGENPFGDRDPEAGVWEVTGTGKRQTIAFNNQFRLPAASLASQAVGPVGSDIEMSCLERTFPFVGRKLLSLTPLALQSVSTTDSVLGIWAKVPTVSRPSDRRSNSRQTESRQSDSRQTSTLGLNTTYRALVQQAFHPRYWNSKLKTPDGYTLAEANFSMFFGLSVQLYEEMLASDDAPYDRAGFKPLSLLLRDFAAAGTATDPLHNGAVIDLAKIRAQDLFNQTYVDEFGVLSPEAQRGFNTFMGKGQCVACHSGALFTTAAFDVIQAGGGFQTERVVLGGNEIGTYDIGFYNIGVRPTAEDIGLGRTDPVSNLPLSIARGSLPAGARVDVDGAFKTPSLRNVALTGPYFHNGSRATLAQVIEFYNRGGDARTLSGGSDTSGFNGVKTNLHPSIKPLGLTAKEQAELVIFLEEALTDERVRCEQGPFDHPSIRIPSGHPTTNGMAMLSGRKASQAADQFLDIPAVGASGRGALSMNGLAPFLGSGAPCQVPPSPIL